MAKRHKKTTMSEVERRNRFVAAKVLGADTGRTIVLGTSKNDILQANEFPDSLVEDVGEWAEDDGHFETWTARSPKEALAYAAQIMEVVGVTPIAVVVEQLREWAKELKTLDKDGFTAKARGIIGGLESVADDLEAEHGE